MRLEAEHFRIKLRRPFRIAHGSSIERETILVHLHAERENIVAHGEGALPPYYPSTAEASLEWLAKAAPTGDVAAWEQACNAEVPFEAAAGRAALEIAIQDFKAQRAGKPVWRLWGLDHTRAPCCWRTISLPSSEGELREMLDEAISGGSKHIKLKSGSGDLGWDERCVQLVSKRQVGLGLDANAGWTPAEAAGILSRLPAEGVAFVEQPVSVDIADWHEVRSRIGEMRIPPLLADESLQSEQDFAALQGLADGVNIKLLKAGGLAAAQHWISLARVLGMRVMVGGMIETGIGRTAAAQLAPLADWLDIDPPESVPAAPLIGISIEGDRLTLAERPGLGLLPVTAI